MSNSDLEVLFSQYPGNMVTIIEILNHLIDGWTPIHYAAYNRDEDLLRFLKHKGANLQLLTLDDNQNILHLILKKENCGLRLYTLVERLLEESDLELQEQLDNQGNIPYYYLSTLRHDELYIDRGFGAYLFEARNGLDNMLGTFSTERTFNSCAKGSLEKCISAAFIARNYEYLHSAYFYFP
jgi:hypothetical protein